MGDLRLRALPPRASRSASRSRATPTARRCSCSTACSAATASRSSIAHVARAARHRRPRDAARANDPHRRGARRLHRGRLASLFIAAQRGRSDRAPDRPRWKRSARSNSTAGLHWTAQRRDGPARRDVRRDARPACKSAFARERQFISDASHELKTPLTVINANAQLIRRWGDRDPAFSAESLDAIVDESARLAEMVGGMLHAGQSRVRRSDSEGAVGARTRRRRRRRARARTRAAQGAGAARRARTTGSA